MSDRTPWSELYPPGVHPVLRPRADSMLNAWNRTVQRQPDSPAVRYFNTTHTFSDVEAAANSLAAAFHRIGLVRGDRVAIYLQNDPQWLVAMLAAWKCGAVAVAANPMLVAAELAALLTDASPRVLVCLDSLYGEVVMPIRDVVPVEVVVTTNPVDMLDGSDAPPSLEKWAGTKQLFDDALDWAKLIHRFRGQLPPELPIESDSIAVITYTSGTTGRAKGAMNTHGGMVHSSQVYAEWFSLDSHDVVLGIAPLFHITGSVAGLGVTILTGAPIVLLHRFDALDTLRAIERWGATFTVATSTAYIALIDAAEDAHFDLSSLCKAATGGAAVSAMLVDRVRAATGWWLHTVYGLTETTSPSHICPLDASPPIDPDTGAMSVGVPVPGAQVRIVDIDRGVDLPAGGIGEIAIAGPMVVPGYWNAPDESRLAIRDGWLFTGDVGTMNEDGWLFVIDRKKDLINAGGYKVWPREVEEVLCQHPQVREAVVVGIPDEYRGETVKAYVSLTTDADVGAPELIEFCKHRLAAYKYPRSVQFVTEIPKTASGKLMRRAMRGAQ